MAMNSKHGGDIPKRNMICGTEESKDFHICLHDEINLENLSVAFRIFLPSGNLSFMVDKASERWNWNS